MKECFVAGVITLLVSCTATQDASDDDPNSDTVEIPSVPEQSVSVSPCGAADTYETIKEILFDQVSELVDGDRVAINDLRRSVAVNMKFPRVSGVQAELDRTDCSGRLILGIPPIAREAFGGESELKADIDYSVQPAADGSGDIVSVSGIGYVVQQIVAAETLRASRKLAARGGPQLEKTFNPSFDCGANLSNTERMICQNEDLAALDRRLSAAFKQKLARAAGDNRTIFLTTQRNALAERAECPDIGCLSRWYEYQLSTY